MLAGRYGFPADLMKLIGEISDKSKEGLDDQQAVTFFQRALKAMHAHS